MEFKSIIHETALWLVGMNFYGDPFSNASPWEEANAVGTLWGRFMNLWENAPEAIKEQRTPNQMAEIFFETGETEAKGVYEVFVGVIVHRINEIPLSCVAKYLPANTYAVFTLRGAEITDDWLNRVVSEWLPTSGYRVAANYSIQIYDQRFQGVDRIDVSEIDVYIPIQPCHE